MTLYQRIVVCAALMTRNFGGPYVFRCHRHGPSAGRHVPGCRHPGCVSHVRRSPLAEMLPWVLLQLCRPKMTVERSSFRSVPCVWFDEDENLHRKEFAPGELERVST